MNKKLIISFAVALLMLFTALPAFAASNIQLQVNGDSVPSPGVSLVEGASMVSVENYVYFAGADLQWANDKDFTITENGQTMKLSLGSKEALFGDKSVALTAQPIKQGDTVVIPLRSVSEAFGFKVVWNSEQSMAILTRDETRDGMTVSELLAKSSAASQDVNSYSMDGLFDINLNISQDGKAVEQAPQKITTKLSGQMQNKPFQAYIKQTVTPLDAENVPAMDVETYMTEEKMYIKAPGQDWIMQDMPFSPEFLKQQQDIQSDPLRAAQQMKDMGILLNYGNDVTVDGKDYYVINAALDMEKFMQGYQKLIQQATSAMPQGSSNPADMQQLMQKIFETAQMEYNYSILINKKTLISDKVKFDARLLMTIPDQAQSGDQPKAVNMDMKLKGDINITELGTPFSPPDVSTAKAMTVNPQAAPNNQ